jgi:hemerythrin superfamily protein
MTADILSRIKEQHEKLRVGIKVLKSENASDQDKQERLEDFIDLLKRHSEAEEETIYDVMKSMNDEQTMIFESVEEHAIAKHLVKELEDADYSKRWNHKIAAKAKVLAEIVEHHAKEEEQDLFPDARKVFTKMELDEMGTVFQEICESYDDEMPKPSSTGDDEVRTHH